MVTIFLVGQIIPVSSDEEKYDVIIVGAGMAGLTAANELKSNEKNVLVLEARGDDRIGGRTFTNTTLGFYIDEGASWIHGIDDNPIITLGDEFNLKRAHTDEDSSIIYDTDGEYIGEEREMRLWDLVEELKEFIAIEYDPNNVISINSSYEDWVTKFIDNRNLKSQDIIDLNIAVSFDQELDFAADTEQLSIDNDKMGFRIYSQIQNDDVFEKGYSGIIDNLVDKLGKDRILTSNVVNKVEYDKNGVLVTSNQGTYTAQHVIVTVPIGVLELGKIEFSPKLPISKNQAIENLEMGVLNKNFLIFNSSDIFWKDDEHDFIHILTEGEPVPGFLYVNFFKHTNAPILMAFTSGEYAKNLENLPDEQIVSKLMKPLQAVYESAPAKPENALITRWAADPYSHGSYSYLGIGASTSDYDEMRKTIQNRIYFAGEGTSYYPGTVHGAYFSGIYQVEKILNPDAPKKQMHEGVSPTFVLCKEGLQLLVLDEVKAVCVFEDTSQKLITRGWVKIL